ncbi:hypothetical protein H9P43_006519 [Blastocladiella emersonii ATCC 22665]|nr:hypothetical protein H9P43_006519 [Blastocladiella emersonii ATCC 22665]
MASLQHLEGTDTTATDNVAYIQTHATRGDPASVLTAMDAFARSRGGLMHVGDDKGPLVVERILGQWTPTTASDDEPLVMVELGAFLGYSAVLLASALRAKFPTRKVIRYLSFEVDPTRVAAAQAAADWAGLGDIVRVCHGSLEQQLAPGGALADVPRVDLCFIDHWKQLYKADAERLVASGKLVPGSALIADNVITPGAPEYLAYIRAHKRFDSVHYPTVLEYTDGKVADGIEVSVFRATDRA